ncbi:uncharacterized protein [Antedon mediterranea]|uniref:uncharacterized protein isoform X2 n=1 Tax=Antedon mediterranea TaxID=105859 RepID=UPI003AF9F703
MDFEKLLKLASKNQKNAEKELPQTKRYSTNLPPPKKAERKVNSEAIRALINKKEKPKQVEKVAETKNKVTTLKNGTKEKQKEKKVKDSKVRTTESKKSKIEYKSKEHESKHKHFMNMIEKDKEKKQEKKYDRPSKEEKKKKTSSKQPMNFKDLMELAKKKQNGEMIVEAKPTEMSEEKQTSSSKKNGVRKTEPKEKRQLDFKKDSAKVKLRNGQNKIVNKISNGVHINNPRIPDAKVKCDDKKSGNGIKRSSEGYAKNKTAVNGKQEDGLKKSIASGTNNQNAIAVLGGKLKKPMPPQHRSSNMPPQHRNSNMPPQHTNSNMPPQHTNSNMPPQHRRQVNGTPVKRKAPPPKGRMMKLKRGRLCSDDEDDEDDDFIDDTGEDVDVSKYIRQIFGYDKRNYGFESEHALNNMEASYSQIMKEETRSTRLGVLEDLEDMKKEKMDLERKKAKKKR